MRRLTQKDIISRIKEVHGDTYDLSKVNYVNRRTKILVGCKNHDSIHYWETTTEQLFRGQVCNICGKNNASKKRRVSFKEFIKTAESNHPKEYWNRYKVINESYTLLSGKVSVICKKHNIKWDILAQVFAKGQGCRECSFEKTSLALRMPLSEIIEKGKRLYNDKYDYSKTKQPNNQNDEILVICPKHGEFNTIVGNHISSNLRSGCPICNASRGEKKLIEYFTNKNIPFEVQKTFKDLRNERKLRFDFYIKSINTVIEFNGRQHYEPVTAFGGKEAFKECQKLDNIKKQYCVDNNIYFEVIKYDQDINIRMDEILTKYS